MTTSNSNYFAFPFYKAFKINVDYDNGKAGFIANANAYAGDYEDEPTWGPDEDEPTGPGEDSNEMI